MATVLKLRRGLPPVNRVKLLRRAQRLLHLLQVPERELSLLLTDDPEMLRLNREYRRRNRTTDVLAFSQLEGVGGSLHPDVLGDVVISVPQARRQAKAGRGGLDAELAVLLVHGVLHLLGYEHEGVRPKEARAMLDEQARLVDLLLAPPRP
jgi:rRNA maturation RNase YbeY